MRVFISSLITGMEPLRAAAAGSVRALKQEPVMAEDFGALPQSPQVACLAGVRDSDCVVLILGARYGAKQPSGLSATHEEFREARDRRPVLVFVQTGVQREPDQDVFVTEVQAWQGGQFTDQFSTAEQLRDLVTGGLHRWAVSTATGAPDSAEMLARAKALLPSEQRVFHSGVTTLATALTGGPRQAVLRPVELEDGGLRRHLHKTARFGATPIFVDAEGAQDRIEGHAILLSQQHRSVRLDEEGSVVIRLPFTERRSGLPVLIQEEVRENLLTTLKFASELLDHIDPVQRLSQVAMTSRIENASGRMWRTRQEHAASPDRGSFGMYPQEPSPITLSPPSRPRAVLRQQADQLAEDLTVLFRRQFRDGR